jgi:hypothetical protein
MKSLASAKSPFELASTRTSAYPAGPDEEEPWECASAMELQTAIDTSAIKERNTTRNINQTSKCY